MHYVNQKGTVIALGFFDGVHLGHAQLIEMAKKRASELNVEASLLSFDVSPMSVVTGKNVPLIENIEARKWTANRLFGKLKVIYCPFDDTVMAMPWQDFITSLKNVYDAVYLVIGHDFRCGHKGEGNSENISAFCRDLGMGCDVISEYKIDGITVSSSYIRRLISEGDMERARQFLGHPYCIYGRVSDGRKIGRSLGTPTINLGIDAQMQAPAKGVYATKVVFDDLSELPAVTNVGTRPTFGENGEMTVESYILDFNSDLYGENVRIDFYNFIRAERKFSSRTELSEQIHKDAETARNMLK